MSGSSLVLIGILGVSRRVYGLLFAATSLGLMVGALSNARLSRRGVSHARLIAWGLAIIVVTSVLLLALTLAGAISVWVLVPLARRRLRGAGDRPAQRGAGRAGAGPGDRRRGERRADRAADARRRLSSAIVAAWFDGRSAISVTAMMALTALASAAVYALVVRPAERDGR